MYIHIYVYLLNNKNADNNTPPSKLTKSRSCA